MKEKKYWNGYFNVKKIKKTHWLCAASGPYLGSDLRLGEIVVRRVKKFEYELMVKKCCINVKFPEYDNCIVLMYDNKILALRNTH